MFKTNRKNRRYNDIRKKFFLLNFCFFYIIATSASPYGQIVDSKPFWKVWWTESTYKIMKDDPIPETKGKVTISAAKNEIESFQLVLSPEIDIRNVEVSFSDFINKDGSTISSENISIRKVEYVKVTKPSGKLHQKGWYPDPLPICNKPFDAAQGVNSPLWFTVEIPKNTASGKFKAKIRLKSESGEATIPVELNVWNFALPDLPYMRSGFNLKISSIKQYHNLDTKEELEEVTDKYFRSFKDYKISPYYFDALSPIKRSVKGIRWSGGYFDSNTTYEGKYSYQVKTNGIGRFTELVEINPAIPYLLKWQAKTLPENQKYMVTIKCYDQDKKPIYYSLKWMKYEGSANWRQDTMYIDPEDFFTFEDLPDYRSFPENARYASVHLHAPSSGDIWFDDFQFVDVESGENILPYGNFEQDIDELNIVLDFTEFDIAARKYLDGFGFSGFRLGVPGLGKSQKGALNGFISGSTEHNKLVTIYLKGVQDHLEKNGWLGKEYLYWVDEPSHEHYKFVREGMDVIHEAAPKLKRFITENNPGPEIMDVTEIGCPVLYKVKPDEVKKWKEKGREYWSYLMCWPKEPHVNLFIDSDAINLRMWIWMSYRYNLEGILVWQSNQWNGARGAAPNGIVQNIWEDPMTYKSGHGTPYGSAPEFGNGDGMFFYPPNRDPNNDKTKYLTGPVPSIRLEILREGLDDYDYMMMLEECVKNAKPDQNKLVKKAKQILDFGADVFVSDLEYTKDPKVLMKYRRQMGELLSEFYGAK